MHLADIAWAGMTRPGERWDRSLLDLAVEAAAPALKSGEVKPTALIVGNALSGALRDQRNISAHLAARLGLNNCETFTVEADEASGGAAFRMAIGLVSSGFHETVLAVGAEKTTDILPDILEKVRACSLDVIREAGFGFGQNAANGLLMNRYLEEYKIDRSSFYHLSALAHEHAKLNNMAYLSWPLSMEQYKSSQVTSSPCLVCDNAPPCDGAAAVIVTSTKTNNAVQVLGSSSITCETGISRPVIDLKFPAAQRSAEKALLQAGLTLGKIDFFELFDSSSIMAALSLESVGLADPGLACELAKNGELTINGRYPQWTFGGNKARGHAIGASGMYQMVEAFMQLTGSAGDNQVQNAEFGLVQCLGSLGSTAVTHVLAKG